MSNYRSNDHYPNSSGGGYDNRGERGREGGSHQSGRGGGYRGEQGGRGGYRVGSYQGNRGGGQRGGYQGNRDGHQGGHQGNRGGYQKRDQRDGGYRRNNYQGGYQNHRDRQDDRREPREFTRRTGTDRDLIERLHDLDGRNYGAYKSVIGDYDYGDFKLHVDRIQSDPYAPPSQLRATASPETMGIPADLLETADQRLAVADFLAREFAIHSKPTEEIRIARSGQEILQRSYATVSPTHVELRFQCQFPARGRTILGHAMARLADVDIPYAVIDTFDFVSEDSADHLAQLRRHVETYVDYLALQGELQSRGWIGFVADGSVLARRSGISDLPLTDATAFTSPDSLRETVSLPHAGEVTGMALRPGVTVIVGGGYHGKSTLLNALQRGVYAHVPEDGRELVALVPDAMKVRAADGRCVTGVDVSAFINGLPGGGSTTQFSTENASGSTSQAASIVEALEVGVPVVLIDEDTSATNLMIRDERMRALVVADKEPITPFVDRIAGLAASGVSTVLVMGGSGDYLDVADLVLMMDNYECVDVTEQARQVVADRPRHRSDEDVFPPVRPRYPLPGKTHGGRAKTKSRGLDQISLDRQDIDVSDVEQIVDAGQTEAIAWSIRTLLDRTHANSFDGSISLADALARLDRVMDDHGLDGLGSGDKPAFLVRPRRVDVAAALNRFRSLRVATEPTSTGEDGAAESPWSAQLAHPRVARLRAAVAELGFASELDYLDSEDGPALFAVSAQGQRHYVAALADAGECAQIDALIGEDDVDAGDHPLGDGGFLKHWVELQIQNEG